MQAAGWKESPQLNRAGVESTNSQSLLRVIAPTNLELLQSGAVKKRALARAILAIRASSNLK
jgi:hypothetical protein